MRKKLYIFLISLAILALAGGIYLNCVWAKIENDADNDGLSDRREQNVYHSSKSLSDTDGDGYIDGEEVFHGYSPIAGDRALLKLIILDAPHISEAPDGNWTGPWKNACEEATIAMAHYYYAGFKTVDVNTSKAFMWNLFDKQNTLYGSNADADATRTAYLIDNYSFFQAKIISHPTTDMIKKEIQQNRPVISLHYGFDLKNKNIPFLAGGSSYHMMLIVGYDDTTGEFIVNDPGDTKAGKFHRYEYKLFMNTLHDFDFTTHQANGPAKVIFTYPRLARDYSDGRIYFLDIDKKIKQHVVSLAVFKEKNWSWDMVVDVWDEWLDEFSAGKDLDSSASAGPSAPISVQPAVNRYTFTRDLSLGSSGEEVKQLQIRLKELKYYTYPQITGYFGPVTQTAVVALQKAKGLAPYPGTVGPLTRKVLNSY